MTLRDKRKEMGLTMKQVAEMVRTSEANISLIETGKRHPTVRLAKRLGKLLGVPWTDFFKDVA